ncbi:MAG: BMP family ABC transporter substrate-binding protein [bacterium]
MNRFLLTLTVLFLVICGFVSCTKKNDPVYLKVGLVSGTGTFEDHGYNQDALKGLMAASSFAPFEWEARNSYSTEAIDSNIQYFIRNNFNVIITLGFDAADYTLAAANANPSVTFILVDYFYSQVPANVVCNVFDVDQASFPCGFLAAYWAFHRNPLNPKTGYVAGPNVPTIQQFAASYIKGGEYFNNKYGKTVLVSGVNSNSFADTVQGAHLADSLIQQGAEVIFAFAGLTGTGALHKVKSLNKFGIGVDVDQFYSIPQVSSVLLTSCMKRLDVVVQSEIMKIYNGTFQGGVVIHYNLKNNGVDIAPYHDYGSLIPDTIKQAVADIKTGIMNGTIPTGWPPK